MTIEEARGLLALLWEEVTDDDSARIKRLIRERGPLWEELADMYQIEADEVYRESSTLTTGIKA